MTQGRGVTDKDWIQSSLYFDRRFKENVSRTGPEITKPGALIPHNIKERSPSASTPLFWGIRQEDSPRKLAQ